MDKPVEPKAPQRPHKPQKTITKKKQVGLFDEFLDMDLASFVQEQFPGVPLSSIFIGEYDRETGFDWFIDNCLYCYESTPNPKYEQDLEKYERNLQDFEEKLAIYRVELKVYNKSMIEYYNFKIEEKRENLLRKLKELENDSIT